MIQRTNFVTAMAIATASNAREIRGILVNIDLLLAEALFHDLSKAIEDAPTVIILLR